MNVFDIAAVLVGLSTLFSYINYRVFHLPSTIGLVVISLAASLTVIGIDLVVPTIHIAEPLVGIFREIDFNETLMHGMLSFLLFAGGLHADFSMFKSRGWTIGVMALLGTLMSTFVVGGLMWFLLGIFDLEVPFIWALAFGALISPTDPVAVLGLFKIVKVPKSLEATMAGESMFNDGVGVVVFTVVVAIAVGSGEHGGSLGPIEVVTLFLIEAGGGVVFGSNCGLHRLQGHARNRRLQSRDIDHTCRGDGYLLVRDLCGDERTNRHGRCRTVHWRPRYQVRHEREDA
jgi:CPA1 family monovalent cation:H+ antiporter